MASSLTTCGSLNRQSTAKLRPRDPLTSLEGVRDDAEERLKLSRTNGKRAAAKLCSVCSRRRSGRAGKHTTVAIQHLLWAVSPHILRGGVGRLDESGHDSMQR
jgi:hypothetical protein